MRDVIYLKPQAFDTAHTQEMAAQLKARNAQLRGQGEGYILLGFGRWGSSIPSLGVPVQWSDISQARAIVECCLENFRVDPSQGTHFFQNLTSFNAGYINVDPFAGRGDRLDFSVLDSMPAVWETEYIRQVRFDRDMEICIDGRASRAFMK